MRKLLAAALLALSCSHAPPPKPEAARGWIERSNENAQLLLDVQAQFSPESAAREGMSGLDERITDFTPGNEARERQALHAAQAQLEQRLAKEQDPLVKQDLEILLAAAKRDIEGSELEEKLAVRYHNLPRLIFGVTRALLDPQIAAERRPAALVRVRKYLDAHVVQLCEDETREGLRRGLLAPSRIQLENDLDTAEPLLDGVEKLFAQYQIAGWQEPVAQLRKELEGYLQFVKSEVLPKAREDFRLPPELYAFRLRQVGVDIPADELARRAHAAFDEIQAEMQKTARKVAQERGYASADYRDVIKELKKAQIPDEQVLDFYKHRLEQIEGIIRAQRLVTLPNRPARIRIGSPAENAQQPAPHMVPPRLIGNHGEEGEFVLPLSVPGKTAQKYDDFNFDSAAWTLTAHEARPGHELQFSRMVETGVSLARAIFAFNSVNVEGWGLYAESITLPYMPLDGQLISLQLRLQRAARAFLDPELQIPGKWTPEAARAFLQREVGLSPAFATEEVDRFTFRMPGQATAYFYGYTKLIELRAAEMKKEGDRFDALRFHDRILSQGLLPPELLKKAILQE